MNYGKGRCDWALRVLFVFGFAVASITFAADEGPVPNLPETTYQYADIDLPFHFTNPNAPGGSVVDHDNEPADNLVSDAGATLGRVLFYDKRLSINDTTSCSSCHQQAHGFSDPAVLSTGFEGGLTGRHSMGLSNARYYERGHFFWDERADTLEDQVVQPVQDPVEMGMDLNALVAKLSEADFYPPLFEAAFGDPAISADRISLALSQFVRSLVSYRSKYDLALGGNGGGTNLEGILTEQELLGHQLFNNPPDSEVESVGCVRCHGTNAQISENVENNGLDQNTDADDGAGNGRFKAPSLRDVASRPPYMHDGRFQTLEEVVEFYNSGVQNHPGLSPRLRQGQDGTGPPQRLNLADNEKTALVAFLEALTDPFLLNDVRFSDPFAGDSASLDVFSGSWIDPTRGGEGWTIEVINDNTAVIFWFTFDENGDRTWLIGVADRNGSTISANMLLATGPVFGLGFDQESVEYQDWGTLDIDFETCHSATLEYSSVLPGYGSDALILERLVGIDGLDCDRPSTPASNRFSGWTGSWVDLDHGGEGWTIEVIDEDTAVIFWFTFDENGDHIWMIGVASRSGNTLVADLLLASGPVFGLGFDNDNVEYQDWGSIEISFNNCNEATLVFTSQLSGFGSGTMEPRRLTSLAGLDCEEPPNILMVIADDFGLDALSAYDIALQAPVTPVLDDLANEGLIFDQFWANPTCSPTRASLLTGKHSIQTGVYEPGDDLADTELTVQQYLEMELPGTYANAVIGKWHVSRPNDLDHPEQLGVQHFAGNLSGTFENYNDWVLTVNGEQSTSTEYITSKYVDLSLEWIEDQDQPWFLWLAMTAPHEPFHLPPEHLHTQDLSGTAEDIQSNPLPYYQAMVESMDTEIGRLLNGLDAEERENTLIIFMGDNGTPRRVVQAPYQNTQAKGSLYQGGINVPLFVTGAGVQRGAQRDASLVSVTDLFATISEVAGIEFAADNQSISFAGLLNDGGSTQREFLYADGKDEDLNSWAVRDERFKLIANEGGRQEVYDLFLDPFENTDLVTTESVPAGIIEKLEAHAAGIQQ